MQKLIVIVILFAAMMFSTVATSASIQCNTCDYNAAQQQARVAGTGSHLIYNYATRQIWAFQVTYVAKARSYNAKSVQVDPSYVTVFSSLATYWHQNGGSLKTDIVIRPGDPRYPPGIADGSAFDAAVANSERNFYLNSMPPVIDLFPSDSFFSGIQNIANILATNVFGVEFTVTIYFNDGSSIKVKYAEGNSNTPIYVAGSATDSDGNQIPDPSAVANPGQFVGVNTFSTDANLADWIFAAQMYGITVTNGSSGSGTITVGGQMVCSNTVTGIVCVMH